MRMVVALGAMLMVVGCGTPEQPTAGPSKPTESVKTTVADKPSIPATATPYQAPAQPPAEPGPLDIHPSLDAHDRLSAVLTGTLVDSGKFHGSRYNPDSPMEQSDTQIAFTTPSGAITCTGATGHIVCLAISDKLPRPPKPVNKPSGNWEPYIELGDGMVTYGIPAGNPMTPAEAAPLPYGSTLRFGDVECLSAQDGITCVDIPASTGFHLSRDDLTPMKSATPLPADTRAEP